MAHSSLQKAVNQGLEPIHVERQSLSFGSLTLATGRGRPTQIQSLEAVRFAFATLAVIHVVTATDSECLEADCGVVEARMKGITSRARSSGFVQSGVRVVQPSTRGFAGGAFLRPFCQFICGTFRSVAARTKPHCWTSSSSRSHCA